MTFANLANSISNIDVGIKSDTLKFTNRGKTSIYNGDLIVTGCDYSTPESNSDVDYRAEVTCTENFMLYFSNDGKKGPQVGIKCFNSSGVILYKLTTLPSFSSYRTSTYRPYTGNKFKITPTSGEPLLYQINNDCSITAITSITSSQYYPTIVERLPEPIISSNGLYDSDSEGGYDFTYYNFNGIPPVPVRYNRYAEPGKKLFKVMSISNNNSYLWFMGTNGFQSEDNDQTGYNPSYIFQEAKINGKFKFLCGTDAWNASEMYTSGYWSFHDASAFHYAIATSYAGPGSIVNAKLI